MASFIKQVSSTGTVFYKAIWYVYTGEIDAKGNRIRKQKTKSFDKQSDAKAHARKMEDEIENAGVVDVERQTFALFAKRLLAYWEGQEEASVNTARTYACNLATLSRFIGHLEIGKITPMHIDQAMVRIKTEGRVVKTKKPPAKPLKPLSQATLSAIFTVGDLAMQQAKKWKLVGSNPFKDAARPKLAKRPVTIMNPDQSAQVYQIAADAHDTGKHPGIDVAAAILYTCGLRVGELCGLAFDAVDLGKCTLKLHRSVIRGKRGEAVLRTDKMKTDGSVRTISFPSELVPMLKRQRAWVNEQVMAWGRADYQTEPLLVFPDFGGAPTMPKKMATRMKALQKQAGVSGVKPTHGFRHGMASQMIADGVDIKTVSDRLGHADIAFTLRTYVQAVEGKDKQAAEQMGTMFRAMRTAKERS